MPRKSPPPEPESCGSCKFHLKNDADEYGYCRRNPPTASSDEGAAVTLWPVVTINEWCGGVARKLNS